MTPNMPSSGRVDVLSAVRALIPRWRQEAQEARRLAAKAQQRGDLNDADVRFGYADDAEAFAAELEAALTEPQS